MTNEQAIELLQFYKKGLFDAASNQLNGDIQAFDMAIQALNLMPLIEKFKEMDDWDKIARLLAMALEQEPKTGHWISHYDEEAKEGWYECDRCHTERAFNTDYCPDCGARMVEPQERSE